MKRGFTLIELLVVLAIVAILAAILFPVFASAREKALQITCVSNLRQVSFAILEYIQDYDETYPIGEPKYRGLWTYIPGNATTSSSFWFADTPPSSYPEKYTPGVDDVEWANAIQPYLKSFAVMHCPSTLSYDPASLATYLDVTVAQVRAAPPITYTYNGDLQFLGENAVLAPSSVILVWPGDLKSSLEGFSYAVPQLVCPNGNAICKYAPAVRQESGDTPAVCAPSSVNGATDAIFTVNGSPSFSKWVHGNGDNFAMADGHVVWRPLEGDRNDDPWFTGNQNGMVFSGLIGNTKGYTDGCHSYLFRPDYVP